MSTSYSKILLLFNLSFIGGVFIFSFFGPQWLKIQPQEQRSEISTSVFSETKEKFREIINSNLPNPQSAILSGILLGDKLNISKEWKQKLANTGTSHIVAVSGMNIVILAEILVGLGVLLGLFRQQALWLSLILIWLFIALIGFQASAVRAGIMGSILIFCQILGRQGASFRALCLAVAIMLAIQPELLRYSLSFGLSVLATFGLIQLSPAIETKLKKIKFITATGLPQLVATALSAQVFTLPLLIYSFGSISLVGLLVNILIVPLLPAIMVFGIIFLIGALIYNPLGVVLAWPVSILLFLTVWLIEIFSKIPFSVLRL
ncbi:MAG: ComEC/Rec2 family competence protein [Candidatus Pacebacteria bacterium]|nr:ComEC/Rec2 family competence protein [Candidatus Paceibacterota bacterium]